MELDRSSTYKRAGLGRHGTKNQPTLVHSAPCNHLSSRRTAQLPPLERTPILQDAQSGPPRLSQAPQLYLVASHGKLLSAARERLILDNRELVRIIALRLRARLHGHRPRIEELISDGILGLLYAVDHFDATRGVTFRNYAKHAIRGAILEGRDTEYRHTMHEAPLGSFTEQPLVTTDDRARELRQAMQNLRDRERRVLWLYYENGCTLQEIGTKMHLTKQRVWQIHKRAIAELRKSIAG